MSSLSNCPRPAVGTLQGYIFFFNYFFKYYTVPLFACEDMVSLIYVRRTGELSQ